MLLHRYGTVRSRGLRPKDVTARADAAAVRREDAEATDDSTLHSRNRSRFEREHIDVDTRTANVGAGSTLLGVCSLPGCIPLREGTWGPAVVGIHRS